MVAVVKVVHKWAKITKGNDDQLNPGISVVDTTSNSNTAWNRDLSPFVLGPCSLYDGLTSLNVENAWQFSKVYACHITNNNINDDYLVWAKNGWNDDVAHRYPMGKGAVPEYSYWDGRRLGYIEARKVIYGPLFMKSVQITDGWKRLLEIYNSYDELYLRDWDGWDMSKHNMNNLSEVLNNPNRKMGHSFVLKMMLENDVALEQFEM